MRGAAVAILLAGLVAHPTLARASCDRDNLEPFEDSGDLADIRAKVFGAKPPSWFLQYATAPAFEPSQVVFLTHCEVIQVRFVDGTTQLDIRRRSSPFPIRLVDAVWSALLERAHPHKGACIGLDGTTHFFSRFEASGPPRAGTVWSPRVDSSTGLLVLAAENLRRFVAAESDDRSWHDHQFRDAVASLFQRLQLDYEVVKKREAAIAQPDCPEERPEPPPRAAQAPPTNERSRVPRSWLAWPGLGLFLLGLGCGIAAGVPLTLAALARRRRRT
jgi:hypothetical protein